MRGAILRRLDERGIVLPTVIFVLVVMSVMVVAALLTADDEGRSARAMRESGAAFYAAEAGLHEVYAGWDSIPGIDTLAPGTEIALEWRSLTGGGRYQATVHRWDDGAQPMYQLEVMGRGPGSFSGARILSLALTSGPGGPGSGYKLGECCEAPVTVRGGVNIEDDTGIDGHDTHPPGWGDECTNELEDKPGIVMKDTTRLVAEDNSWIDGEPPIAQNTDLDDVTWEQFGDLSWDSLSEMAEKVFHDGTFRPNPSTKWVDGVEVCNTSDPLNLGSPDPTHPCFDYFPVVLISDDVTFEYGYGQGIFVLAWDEATQQGSEFDLERDLTVNGVILGKGCVEPEENSRFYGGILVDGNYRNLHLCNSDLDYDMNDGDATVQWSTCAVDRAIVNSGLDEWAEVTNPGDAGGVQPLGMRSFGEIIQ